MMTITIRTSDLAEALNPEGDDVDPGLALALLLRRVAHGIEQDIRVLPGREPEEWIRETHRYALRVEGVLLGAVVEITPDSLVGSSLPQIGAHA